MAGINPGRNAGRLSIRVIPDTNKFREDLKKRLVAIEKTTSMAIRVDKARLDKTKIREDIRRQMEGFSGIEAQVNVKVVVDKAKLKKTKLRASIQEQFDKFDDIRVNIAAQILNVEHFEKQVRDMVQRASRNKININANAITAAASAQLKVVTRDRFVNLIVRVTKSSAASALTTLAALSGARLSWQWIDDLATSMRNLDKNLPAIVGWTTSITSLVGSIFAATSGLVGIGQGLFSILPAFLVVPGLILNAIGSLTALIVALRHAGTELGSLKSSMSELGDIINDAFWGQARQPILDLVNNLMPQLRTSFRELSTGIGQFTGELAKAFGEELGNGGLESIFSGIAEGWRILSTGAPAFAGAMTSLSQVAAKYTPRLATWFVRQANTFDNWLEAVSTDGRLDGWMNGAIKSMYDLWDAVTGVAGVFKGLWRAADSAGSKGLAGFADMMQTWDRVVNSADFQRGLTAIFRGASTAMGAFGEGIKAVGRLIVGLDKSIEKFIGSAGTFLGGLIEGAANALNTPTVDKGLTDLSNGLVRALEGILPHLPAIASTFGKFLGLLGDLAGTILPTAAAVLAELMPSVESLISSIRDSGILQTLGDAVVDIAETLGPALADFVDAVGPVLVDAFVELAEALVDISPVIASFVEMLGDFLDGIGDFSAAAEDFFDAVRALLGWDVGSSDGLNELGRLGEFKKDDGNPFTVEVKFDFERYWNNSKVTTEEKARGIAKVFMEEYERVLATEGQGAADALVESFREIDGLPPEVVSKINESLKEGFALPDLSASEKSYLDDVVKKVREAYKTGGTQGAEAMWFEVTDGFKPGNTKAMADWARDILADEKIILPTPEFDSSSGDYVTGQVEKIAERIRSALAADPSDATWVNKFMEVSPSIRTKILAQLGEFADEAQEVLDLNRSGRSGGGGGFSRQLAIGIQAGLPELEKSMRSMKDTVSRGVAGSESWLTPSGIAIMGGLKAGIDGYTPTITAQMSGLGGVLSQAMAGAGSWLFSTGVATMAGMQSGAASGRGGVLGVFAGIPGAAASVMAMSMPAFYGIGAAMMAGIAKGMSDNSGAVSRAAGDAVRKAVSAAQAAGEIHSPSRLTARLVGKPLAQGIGVGFDDEFAGVRKSMSNAIDFDGIRNRATGTSTAESGDVINFYGVTTDVAAQEIGSTIVKTKRRRVRRTGALRSSGVR